MVTPDERLASLEARFDERSKAAATDRRSIKLRMTRIERNQTKFREDFVDARADQKWALKTIDGMNGKLDTLLAGQHVHPPSDNPGRQEGRHIPGKALGVAGGGATILSGVVVGVGKMLGWWG